MGCHHRSVVVVCVCAQVSHSPGSRSRWIGLHQCVLDLMVHTGALREPAPTDGIDLIMYVSQRRARATVFRVDNTFLFCCPEYP
jgi:hypothetical protein